MKTQDFIEVIELEPWQFKVRRKNKKGYYEVIKRRDGVSFHCSCPSVKYNGPECKHIKAVEVIANE